MKNIIAKFIDSDTKVSEDMLVIAVDYNCSISHLSKVSELNSLTDFILIENVLSRAEYPTIFAVPCECLNKRSKLQTSYPNSCSITLQNHSGQLTINLYANVYFKIKDFWEKTYQK